MKTYPNQRTYSTPFGMLVQERVYTAKEYRFGFGGQELDDEISGTGNSYSAEYWQYDPRLGRRFNVDLIVKPWESVYATFSNNPINYIDPSGLTGEECESAEGEKPDIQVTSSAGLAPNGDMLAGSNSNLYINANFGKDSKGNNLYRTVGIQSGDKSYIWDNDKGWYYDKEGNEYDNPWYMDVTNAVGDMVEPTVNMAVDWVDKGDPFYSLKQTFEQSESKNWAGFLAESLVDGAYKSWGDFQAGGYKRQQLLLNMFVGITASGVSPSTLLASKATVNVLQEILEIKSKTGNAGISAGSAVDAISIGKAWVSGPNIRNLNVKGGIGWTDGVHSFRLSYKNYAKGLVANFQENKLVTEMVNGKAVITTTQVRNVHMIIK